MLLLQVSLVRHRRCFSCGHGDRCCCCRHCWQGCRHRCCRSRSSLTVIISFSRIPFPCCRVDRVVCSIIGVEIYFAGIAAFQKLCLPRVGGCLIPSIYFLLRWKLENEQKASRSATLSHQTTLAGFAQIFLSENSAAHAATRSITFSLIAPGTITHAEQLHTLPSGTPQHCHLFILLQLSLVCIWPNRASLQMSWLSLVSPELPSSSFTMPYQWCHTSAHR